MRYAVAMGVLFAVGLTIVGCPATSGRLVVVNDSAHTLRTLSAKNLDGDYIVQLVVPDNPDLHIAPGETGTFSIAAEGYYSVFASAGYGMTWYYGQSIYFSPGVTVTWTISDGKDNGWVEYSDAGSDSGLVPASME